MDAQRLADQVTDHRLIGAIEFVTTKHSVQLSIGPEDCVGPDAPASRKQKSFERVRKRHETINLQTVRMQQVVIVRKHLSAIFAIVIAVVDIVEFRIGKVDLSIWYVQSETCEPIEFELIWFRGWFLGQAFAF